jgi:hypothetical protein
LLCALSSLISERVEGFGKKIMVVVVVVVGWGEDEED